MDAKERDALIERAMERLHRLKEREDAAPKERTVTPPSSVVVKRTR